MLKMYKKNERTLRKASINKVDDFYTMYEDIERECSNYISQFSNKIIYCNFDNPDISNFTKYFLDNKEKFNLKDVWSTCIDKDGNGDFRSDKCLELLKQCDIVVTNPAFSLFRDEIKLLEKYNKKYLLVGNLNQIICKNIFPLFLNKKLKLGYNNFDKSRFILPPGGDFGKSIYDKEIDGIKYVRVSPVFWYTNLDVNKEKYTLNLTLSYEEGLNQGLYQKFDNTNILNIDKVNDIPYDYNDIMAIPLTFLYTYNDKSNYDIIGMHNGGGKKYLINGKNKYHRLHVIKKL
jgi:hypothetical protein